MDQIHVTPDGLTFIRTGNFGVSHTYFVTPQPVKPFLRPMGVNTVRLYEPGVRHFLSDGKDQVAAPEGIAWPKADAIIAKLKELAALIEQ